MSSLSSPSSSIDEMSSTSNNSSSITDDQDSDGNDNEKIEMDCEVDSDCEILKVFPKDEEEYPFIGVVQMTSTADKEANKNFCFQQIKSAKAMGAKMVFLPECFDFVPAGTKECYELAETLEGPLIKSYQELASSLDIWISLGGFHQRLPCDLKADGNPHIANTHVLIDDCGKLVSVYDKIHSYDLLRPVRNVITPRESDLIVPGSAIHFPEMTPIGNVGLGINYDLRFPEYALKLRILGAAVLTYPSAIAPKWRDHWEVLLRARAIENQCFVIAAAQIGSHNDTRESYGHSMVVDPRGKIIAEATENDDLLMVAIKRPTLEYARDEFPTMYQRRGCVYNLSLVDHRFLIPSLESGDELYKFGESLFKRNVVFLESTLSRAIPSSICVRPGHVLVLPKKPVKRLHEMSEVEIADIFQLSRHVESIMESIHNANSSIITVQDGDGAGSKVAHVHVHILPRQPDDYSTDQIRRELENRETQIQYKSENEMEEDANAIRKHIHENFQHILWELPLMEEVCS